MTNRPDPELVERYVGVSGMFYVRQWVEALGLDHWTCCPPLAVLLPYVAIVNAAEDIGAQRPELSATDCIRAAVLAVGVEDDGSANYHPGDNYRRTLNNWKGNSFPASDEDAA